jgi:hypothetical protein
MGSEQEVARTDNIVESIIYAFFVALLAYLITNQLIGAVVPPGRFAGFLFIMSLPAVVVLSALSFYFYKYFKAQENMVIRYSLLVANSLVTSVLGVLITYPFVAR